VVANAPEAPLLSSHSDWLLVKGMEETWTASSSSGVPPEECPTCRQAKSRSRRAVVHDALGISKINRQLGKRSSFCESQEKESIPLQLCLETSQALAEDSREARDV
jgi:hypothetical protein